MHILKKILKTSAISLLVLTLAILGYAALNPLLMRDLKHTAELFSHGVKPLWGAGLSGYRAGYCEDGKPCHCIALLHGMGDQALGWRKLLIEARESDWGKQQEWVALNLPSNPPNPSVRAIARQVEDALRPLCSKWTVVGNSYGGWIASWTALQWPTGVEKLVLIGSAGLKSARTSDARSYFKEPTVESLKEFFKKAYAHPRMDLDDKTLAMAVKKMRSSNMKSQMEFQTAEDDLDQPIKKLTQPLTLIWGEKDQIIPPSAAREFKRLVPRATYHELKDCGHLPQKECAADLLKALSL